MTAPGNDNRGFSDRVRAISAQGLGLSVDVYSPNLIELVGCLTSRGLSPDYLEIFKAPASALEFISRHVPGIALSYHGEGLWITQPESRGHCTFDDAEAEAAAHLNVLQSPWLTHECGTKQMGGYSFGTYLPPLYTPASAAVIAQNINSVQAALDTRCRRPDGSTPLFLLEMPPLTYFMAGTIPIAKFYRLVTQLAPCGLVLDMGHLWTVYRYGELRQRTTLFHFVRKFLDEFPMERVVQIHVAGLTTHETTRARSLESEPPQWLDAHAAPIPPILFDMLEQVLAHRSLTSLRGVALEVDTKPIELILDEFGLVSRRFSPLIEEAMLRGTAMSLRSEEAPYSECQLPNVSPIDRQQLFDDYRRYVKIVSGLAAPVADERNVTVHNHEGLERYRRCYLPHEILEWGGALTEMFSEGCRALRQRGIALEEFVGFWFREPRPITQMYDFFLLKIERFVEFVRERAPDLTARVEQEAADLRAAYAKANELTTPVSWSAG